MLCTKLGGGKGGSVGMASVDMGRFLNPGVLPLIINWLGMYLANSMVNDGIFII
jgi:hypothetical protein